MGEAWVQDLGRWQGVVHSNLSLPSSSNLGKQMSKEVK